MRFITTLRDRGRVRTSTRILNGSHNVSWKLRKVQFGCFQKQWVFPPQIINFIGFSIINHPFWGVSLFLETPICSSDRRITALPGPSFYLVGVFKVGWPRAYSFINGVVGPLIDVLKLG